MDGVGSATRPLDWRALPQHPPATATATNARSFGLSWSSNRDYRQPGRAGPSPTGVRLVGTVGRMARTAPAAPESDSLPSVAYLIAVAVVAGGILLGAWIALVGQADLQDNIAGLCVAGFGLLVGWLVSVQGRAVPQFHRSDLATIAGLGPRLVAETIAVYAATWRRVRGHGGCSGFRTLATDAGGGGWRSARRSGVVAALLSFTPDTVVVDIDAQTGVATVHDFVARVAQEEG